MPRTTPHSSTRPSETFPSVLFPTGLALPLEKEDASNPQHCEDNSRPHTDTTPGPEVAEPDCFHDLNLDQIVSTLTAGDRDYDLTWLYRSPLHDTDAVAFRHEVFHDLDREELASVVRAFVERRVVFHARSRAAQIREDNCDLQHYYRERFFLNAVDEYCVAVLDLQDGLRTHTPASLGLSQLATYLESYTNSANFRDLREHTRTLETDLDNVSYVVAIRGDHLTVAGSDDEPNYGQYVAATFDRFQQQPSTTESRQFRDWEAYAGTGVLDLVAQLYPALFGALDTYCGQHLDYLDPVIAAFDHDINFYLSYLDFIAPLRHSGLPFSYPRLSSTDRTEQALDTFDLALARKLHAPQRPTAQSDLASAQGPMIVNDFALRGGERILVISGPNNGGKTTLARTFGQLHYLGRLGCPIPGRDTQLFLCDQIFTHFERVEDSTTMVGRLQTELNRLRDDFATATSNSVFILNEVFNSTTAADALDLSSRILEKVTGLNALGVCVTFLDELATLNEATVSMVSTVVPDDPATRTHKVIRQPADGRAYAHAIADKYELGFDQLVDQLSHTDAAGSGS